VDLRVFRLGPGRSGAGERELFAQAARFPVSGHETLLGGRGVAYVSAQLAVIFSSAFAFGKKITRWFNPVITGRGWRTFVVWSRFKASLSSNLAERLVLLVATFNSTSHLPR